MLHQAGQTSSTPAPRRNMCVLPVLSLLGLHALLLGSNVFQLALAKPNEGRKWLFHASKNSGIPMVPRLWN